MALGKFSKEKIIEAAVHMSEGKTLHSRAPTSCHPNGWGAVWSTKENNTISIYRNSEPISATVKRLPLNEISGNFLAIHVRHATMSTKIGLKFTHPISSTTTSIPWYMLHNGFLPTIYKSLNMESSLFDTKEYFDYVIPSDDFKINSLEFLSKLNKLEIGGSAANAIIVNPHRIYIVHWMMPDLEFPDYFTMYSTETAHARYIASEIQPLIAPYKKWNKLAPSSVTEFVLD